MNLWPFSKKNDAPLDSQFELPPGVLLAPESDEPAAALHQESSEHITLKSLHSDMEAAATQFEPEANLQVGDVYTPDPVFETPQTQEIQNISAPAVEAPYPNNHLLDLFTPPATPDIGWGSTTSTTPNASSSQPASDLLGESFAMSEASQPAPLSDVTSFDEPFEIIEESIGFNPAVEELPVAIEYGGVEFLPEVGDLTPEPADTFDITEPSLNNVVPFPVRHTQSSEMTTDSLGITETTDPVIETPLLDSSFALEFTETNASDEAAVSTWETSTFEYSDFEVGSDLSSETISWETPTNTEIHTYEYELTPPEDLPSTGIENFWQQDEVIPLYEENSVHFNVTTAEEISLESAVTPLEAYDSVLGLQPGLIDDINLEPEANWEPDEIEGTSSVKEWATYDMGHYDDPDDVVEPLVLDEEPVSPLSIIEEVLYETIPEESEAVESVMAEPMTSQMTEPAKEPLQGEIVTSEWKKPTTIPTASKALNDFSQQVLLEESHAIKRSIDDLVNRYFAKQS